ncbi:sirohydrochlorin chelatase [Bailinhaonella thermotolerans]|uniref:sirohydrochlorin chelatase n=1 Tax=Bailinhaonella thermotolerans TaxID=1070861 RepID=UPI001F5BDE8D|nr:CbiX/SirB N-terminal domain-containing protein [Bailinhaonella thermotolerans]
MLAAHGTRDPRGEEVTRLIAAGVPGARLGFLEISSPSLASVLDLAPGPAVVVPLLLGGGYHAHVDIPAVVAGRARVAPPLGPHPLLAEALAGRLAAHDPGPGDAVVLGAAGSSDPAGLAAARAMARLLAVRLSRPVTVGFGAAAAPSVERAVARARARGARRVIVAAHLLAPGHFHDRLRASGADEVTEPLGPHPAVLALVRHRARVPSPAPAA